VVADIHLKNKDMGWKLDFFYLLTSCP